MFYEGSMLLRKMYSNLPEDFSVNTLITHYISASHICHIYVITVYKQKYLEYFLFYNYSKKKKGFSYYLLDWTPRVF